MFKIFKRVKELEKKVEELYDVVDYLIHENDSNVALIEEYEERIKSIENISKINYIRLNKDDKEYFSKLKEEVSKFKYDETEC